MRYPKKIPFKKLRNSLIFMYNLHECIVNKKNYNKTFHRKKMFYTVCKCCIKEKTKDLVNILFYKDADILPVYNKEYGITKYNFNPDYIFKAFRYRL